MKNLTERLQSKHRAHNTKNLPSIKQQLHPYNERDEARRQFQCLHQTRHLNESSIQVC